MRRDDIGVSSHALLLALHFIALKIYVFNPALFSSSFFGRPTVLDKFL